MCCEFLIIKGYDNRQMKRSLEGSTGTSMLTKLGTTPSHMEMCLGTELSLYSLRSFFLEPHHISLESSVNSQSPGPPRNTEAMGAGIVPNFSSGLAFPVTSPHPGLHGESPL